MVQRFTSDLSYWHIRDNSGRVVQLARSNVQGGTDRISTKYKFTGEVEAQRQKVQPGSGATTAETFAYTYDLAGRLKGSVRFLGTATSSYSRLTEGGISYERNGNLTALTRYNESGTAIQTLSYSYNGPKRNKTGWTYDNHGNVTADPQTIKIRYY